MSIKVTSSYGYFIAVHLGMRMASRYVTSDWPCDSKRQGTRRR